jgi:hypothetical protein
MSKLMVHSNKVASTQHTHPVYEKALEEINQNDNKAKETYESVQVTYMGKQNIINQNTLKS